MAGPSRGSTSSNQATPHCCMRCKILGSIIAGIRRGDLLPDLGMFSPTPAIKTVAPTAGHRSDQARHRNLSLLPHQSRAPRQPRRGYGSPRASIVPAMISMGFGRRHRFNACKAKKSRPVRGLRFSPRRRCGKVSPCGAVPSRVEAPGQDSMLKVVGMLVSDRRRCSATHRGSGSCQMV